jgi:hypothetical protein
LSFVVYVFRALGCVATCDRSGGNYISMILIEVTKHPKDCFKALWLRFSILVDKLSIFDAFCVPEPFLCVLRAFFCEVGIFQSAPGLFSFH